MGPRRSTVRDVARVAGVSQPTVSRYLNGHPYISSETAQAIDRAIDEVNYVPNRTARSLVNRQTKLVAFVVHERPDLFYADANLSRMAAGANSVLDGADYQMMLMVANSEASVQRVCTLIRGGAMDGAILAAMMNEDRIVTELAADNVPIVTASRPVADTTVPWVDTDNVEGVREIARLLTISGAQRVAEIHGPAFAPVSALRHGGLVDGLGHEPVAVAYAEGWNAESGADCMSELLAAAPDLDAVVAGSDLLAAGAITVLRAQGRRVPDDVKVVGFDDAPIAQLTNPQLTTVRQDAHKTGEHMAQLLLRMLADEDLSGYGEIIPSTVVWRESSGPRPA